ncbi:RHS repeat-associated core domain-containing protein [Treponema sp. OMZ 803]|uniref:RHS repeat-associated core domain-containing protein n=1 Tax=Treponema sp. OMZ 803 TaxID=120682 RepID=UPI0020A51807|nr:RHS repeat-associated core domain-containing protein [Treponema sp. OMZ 803]
MKTTFCFYPQLNYPLPWTAIEAEILFAARIIQARFLKRLSGKTPREQNSSGKKIGAESAVLHFVFFIVMVNKMQQSAKKARNKNNKNSLPEVFPLTAILAGSGKTMPFEKRRSRYKETAENKAEAYRVYGEHLFSACDAVDARIFSKGDGETITYTYDKGGQLKGVSGVKNTVKGTETYSYIDTIVYDEHGQRVYIKYGNGVETKYRYDDKRRWLKDIETRNKQTDEVFQKISYRFDKVGNVLGYSNDASVYETSQSYTYDSLYQLIGVEGTSNQYKAIKSFGSTPVHVAKYKQDFAFDGIGNMTRKASTTNLPGARGNAYPKAELDYDLTYEYDPAYAHRLVHAGNRYYRYDANGNITAEKDGPFTEDDEFIFTYNYDPDTDVYGTDYGFGLDAPKETEETHPENLFAYRRNYTWNEKNQLTKSSDRSYTVHYRYGEDGQRALKYTEEGRSETLYFNNFYTIHIPVQDKNNPQGLRVHKHIFVGNSRLVTAMTHTDNNGDNAEQREKRYYYHSDHLGSAQFVTDWKGRQYEHIEYTPYGELWIEEVAAGLDKLPFRFTGKEMDEETGLYYYGARYLDPKYSRWLSGDPALGDYIPSAGADSSELAGMGGVYNTVNLHLYHYAGNNPIKYIDPTGRDDLYYDVNGQYLNTVASETNDVYLRQGSDDNITNTRISTREEFNKVTAAVFGETSGNVAESNAIADVIMNRATSTGRTISDIVENTAIYGYNENSRTTTDNGVASNTNTILNTARAAAIHGYTGTDTSSGAYFWEGTTFLDPQSKHYDPTNWFVRMGWGTTVGTTSNVISYLVTTTIGGTTFMRNNPQYRRVDYP